MQRVEANWSQIGGELRILIVEQAAAVAAESGAQDICANATRDIVWNPRKPHIGAHATTRNKAKVTPVKHRNRARRRDNRPASHFRRKFKHAHEQQSGAHEPGSTGDQVPQNRNSAKFMVGMTSGQPTPQWPIGLARQARRAQVRGSVPPRAASCASASLVGRN